MIHTCEICGNDFLTEADCFVVRPTPNGNKLYCYCQIRGFEEMQVLEKLQAENAKLRECVEFYADKLNWYDNTKINGSDQKAIFKDSEDCLIKSINKHIIIGGKRARQVLKELDEK